MSLHEAIIKTRVELQNTKLHKSGKNKFAGFEYYELSDFLPTLNKLMSQNGLNDVFTIKDGYASLSLICGDEKQEYSIPFEMFEVPLNKGGQPSMQQIQYLGALNTYYKRYLYLNAFGITDGEVIDAMEMSYAPPPSKATANEQKILLDEFKNLCDMYSVNAKDFIIAKLGENVYTDKKLLYKEVRHYMQKQDILQADLEAFAGIEAPAYLQ